MNVIVNGNHYEHIVTELTREAAIEYSGNEGTALSGRMVMDPLGTRLSYTITFDSMLRDQTALKQLWNDLITPRENGIEITVPYNDTEVTFWAKVETVSQGYYETLNGEQVWSKITMSFQSTSLYLEV